MDDLTIVVWVVVGMTIVGLGIGVLIGRGLAPKPKTRIVTKVKEVRVPPPRKNNLIVLAATKGARGRYRLIGWRDREHGTTLFTGGPQGVASEEEAEKIAHTIGDSNFRLATPFVQPTKKERDDDKRKAEAAASRAESYTPPF